MKILLCDCCHVKVNDYGHWYDNANPVNMYELNCIHETKVDTFNGIVLCHNCVSRLMHNVENEEK